MIRNVLLVFKNETKVERFFNQKRDIIHYSRIRLNTKTIKLLIMIRMHVDKNEKLIILSINSVIIESNILNCDDTENKAKN